MQKLAFIALASFVLLSCKENETYAEVGITEVDIVISNPEVASTIYNNEELSVDGRIDANALMSAYLVRIQDAATDSILDEYRDEYVTSQFIVHRHWTPTLSEPSELLITVEALDQNHGILTSKSISVFCQ